MARILGGRSIQSIIDCDTIKVSDLDHASAYDAFVTTSLIWIRENTPPPEYLTNYLRKIGNKPLIPISIGLQAPEFKSDFFLHPDMVNFIKELESRCRLAVRGNYTAEVLKAHNITDIQIVGCPSLYQIPLYQPDLKFLEQKSAGRYVVSNFRTFRGSATDLNEMFLRFIVKNSHGFVEQTMPSISKSYISDAGILKWFKRNSNMFLDTESWIRHYKRYDFSFGMRFHGNVAALLAGKPAIFVTIDSRTQEMTDFFNLPSVQVNEFSFSTPISEQASEVAYGQFIKGYGGHLQNFTRFLEVNSLNLSRKYKERLQHWGISAS